MLFAAGCGRADTGDDVVTVTSDAPVVTEPASSADVTDAPAPVDLSDENAVCFDNGAFLKGSFNWEYFFAKTRAGINSQVRILNVRENGIEDMKLALENGRYILTNGSDSAEYAFLTGGTYDMPESSGFASADVYILTDDPNMTAEAFFGGSIPADLTLGYTTAAGRVIFISYKTN